NLCAACMRGVQREVLTVAPLLIETQIVEQQPRIALRPRHFEKACRQQLIGIHIRQRECDGNSVDALERLHYFLPSSSGRTSARCPVTAAAATMAGDMRCVRAPGPWRPRKLRLVV